MEHPCTLATQLQPTRCISTVALFIVTILERAQQQGHRQAHCSSSAVDPPLCCFGQDGPACCHQVSVPSTCWNGTSVLTRSGDRVVQKRAQQRSHSPKQLPSQSNAYPSTCTASRPGHLAASSGHRHKKQGRYIVARKAGCVAASTSEAGARVTTPCR
jgi:hypothetical protein